MIKMMKHLMPLCSGKFSLRCQEMTVFELILAVAGEAHLSEKSAGRVSRFRSSALWVLTARTFSENSPVSSLAPQEVSSLEKKK